MIAFVYLGVGPMLGYFLRGKDAARRIVLGFMAWWLVRPPSDFTLMLYSVEKYRGHSRGFEFNFIEAIAIGLALASLWEKRKDCSVQRTSERSLSQRSGDRARFPRQASCVRCQSSGDSYRQRNQRIAATWGHCLDSQTAAWLVRIDRATRLPRCRTHHRRRRRLTICRWPRKPRHQHTAQLADTLIETIEVRNTLPNKFRPVSI